MYEDSVIPLRILHSTDGNPPANATALICGAVHPFVARITGGCGEMHPEDEQGLETLFTQAFQGYQGVLLTGGTRMIYTDDTTRIKYGITEVAQAIRLQNPDCLAIGVIPRFESLTVDPQTFRQIIEYISVYGEENNRDAEVMTVISMNLDITIPILTQIVKQSKNVDSSPWIDEAAFCSSVVHTLRTYDIRREWASALVVYNGGATTEYEVRQVAHKGWPVILIAGSGRKADELAADEAFLKTHPSVIVVRKNAQELRQALLRTGAFAPDEARRTFRAV